MTSSRFSVPEAFLLPDGRFIGVGDASLAQSGTPAAPRLQVVLNWLELKQRAPAAK